MNTIIIGDQQYNVEINRKNIRSIRLRLLSSDLISVSCPAFTPDLVIKKFLVSNSDWINKNSKKIITKLPLKDLKTIKILGMTYEVIWHETSRDSILIFDQDKQIHINTSSFSETHLKKLIDTKFKVYALSIIKKELIHLSQEFGIKYNHVTVRNQKSRYGSCSSRNNLNFNWQIILFPYPAFRHILLHEITHLKIKNHKKEFWNLLTFYDPDCKSNNRWLKTDGTKLFLITP